MLSELPYGAFLQYAVRGESEDSKQSKAFMLHVKNVRSITGSDGSETQYTDFVSELMREELAPGHPLRKFLDPGAVLVPIPRSAPSRGRGWLWPSKAIADAMVAKGFGARVVPALRRVKAVQKAAYASSAAERPTAETHYESMEANFGLDRPESITLVDDVVTRGAQMLGAASLIHDLLPAAQVRGFAVFRSIGHGEVEPFLTGMIEPMVDTLRTTRWGYKRGP